MPTAVEYNLMPVFGQQQPGALNGITIVGGMGGLAQLLLPAVAPAPKG